MSYYALSLNYKTIDDVTYRYYLEAGEKYEDFKTKNPGMAQCERVKSYAPMMQLEDTYQQLSGEWLKEKQRLSADIAKIDAKAAKIKDLKRRLKDRNTQLDKLWKVYDKNMIVDYYRSVGVEKDRILFNTAALNGFIDAIQGCINDYHSAHGIHP